MTYDYDVWRRYGFSKNPLDPTPLGATADERPLLVGRETELGQLMARTSNRSGIIIVEGNIGVGKTSFVNAAQYDLGQTGFLPAYRIVEVGEATDPTVLMLSALSNLVYALENRFGPNACKVPALKEGKRLVDVTVEKGIGGDFTFLGTGGGFQTSKTVVQPTVLLSTITQKFDAWMDAATSKCKCQAGVIAVNNFDRLADTDRVGLMNRIRDVVLLRPKTLWLLVGPRGMFNVLESEARRVSEVITGQPVVLGPLPIGKVHEAIRMRAEKFGPGAKLPFRASLVNLLYDVSGGEMRFIFKRLSDVVYEVATSFPSVEMVPDELAMNVLRAIVDRKLSAQPITRNDKNLLVKMAAAKQFRPKDFGRFGFANTQAFFKRIKRFLGMNLLQQERVSTRNILYQTVADVNIMFSETKTFKKQRKNEPVEGGEDNGQ